jgi:putative hydrolase of the HAD superfamily
MGGCVAVVVGTRESRRAGVGGVRLGRDSLPVIVFDGDDTLWLTEPLYDAARREARTVVERASLDGARWEQIQRKLDVHNVARFGLSSKRFPTSCREAYEVLCAEVGLTPVDSVSRELFDAAAEVFEKEAPLVPGADHVVAGLKSRFRLALLTQGERTVQEKRIADSGLVDLFDLVRIVPKKTPETLSRLLDDLRASPSKSWMVGNSVPSDVNPALAIGMRAVWIDAHVWEHERRETAGAQARLVEVGHLADVPAALAVP